MNISYKQSQFELFPGGDDKKPSEDPQKPRHLSTKFILTIENLVIFSIICIMGFIFAYSAGVERGKKVAQLANGKKIFEVVKADSEEKKAVAKAKLKKKREIVKQEDVAEKPAIQVMQAKIELPKKLVVNAKYTIQVASFKSKDSAKFEANSLKKQGFESFVLAKGSYSIVCVGRFEGYDGAKGFAKKLRSKYKDYLIRRL